MRNQEFITEFKRKADELNIKELTKTSADVHENNSKTSQKIIDLGLDLQAIFSKMNKSGLYKSAVALKSEKDNNRYSHKTYNRVKGTLNTMVTFNHKGMGTIEIHSHPDAHQSPQSDLIKVSEMLALLSNPVKVTALKDELKKKNMRTALRIWNSFLNVADEAKALMEIGESSNKIQEIQFESPIELKKPMISGEHNGNNSILKVKSVHIQRPLIQFFANGISLTDTKKEMPEELNSDSDVIAEDDMDDDETIRDKLNIDFSQIEDHLLLIQISDEIRAAIAAIKQVNDAREAKLDATITNLKMKAATQFVYLKMNPEKRAVSYMQY